MVELGENQFPQLVLSSDLHMRLVVFVEKYINVIIFKGNLHWNYYPEANILNPESIIFPTETM